MNSTVASTSLKRKPNDESTSLHSGVPPLPEIRGEILLQVLTHRSLRRSGEISEDFDNERLSELGANVLETAITATLFHRRPLLSGFEILEQRASILCEDNFDAWVGLYRLREKVRCVPDLVPSLKSPEETRLLFQAYVGGVYKEGGLELVLHWLNGLTNDNTPLRSPAAITQAAQPSTRTTEFSGPSPYINAPKGSPPPPPQKKFANPIAPAQPNLAFLPLFNQTATQRRVTVEYPAEFSGPSHAGKWTVKCVVNGIQKGLGAGGSKQVAKEEAARQAWYSLGWS
ncbi:hypothetical protein GYMLUDRAFT_147614 [Collybiopsis luxurians FD-317 M1]|nr:hypothetical protein GYMLUDRAFT_147614 [Collybiopsis luxurians FD-317 M1]